MVVPRGLVFKLDTFIPLDAVIKRVGTTAFVNEPKLGVGLMPWDAPPSRVDRQAKLGPPAAAVDNLYGSRSPSSGVRRVSRHLAQRRQEWVGQRCRGNSAKRSSTASTTRVLDELRPGDDCWVEVERDGGRAAVAAGLERQRDGGLDPPARPV